MERHVHSRVTSTTGTHAVILIDIIPSASLANNVKTMTFLAFLSLPSMAPTFTRLATAYFTAELIFLLAFYFYLLPRANRRKSPHFVEEYADYGKARSKLLVRIIDRIEEHCKREGTEVIPRVEEFLGNWFCVCGDVKSADNITSLQGTSCTDTDTTSTTDDGDDEDEWQSIDRLETDGLLLSNGHAAKSRSSSFLRRGDVDKNGHAATSKSRSSSFIRRGDVEKSRSSSFLRRGDVDIFFAWAFFGKPLDMKSLLDWERKELSEMYQIIEQRIGLRFDRQGTTPGIKPMRLTLDDVRATYRPLAVYGMFCCIGHVARITLRCCGFRHYTSKSGQTYWHRPALDGKVKEIPLLFNHGIAPGGLALYLPMILFGWGKFGKGNADRTVILFENHSISFRPCFENVNEDAYVAGVCEAINTHLDKNELKQNGIAIMGHSFGSCNVTWALRCPEIQRHVRQIFLIDPVSVMLSEPDVMTNFLYAGRDTSAISFVEALRPIVLFPFYYIMDLLRPHHRSRVAKSKRASALFRTYSSYSAGKEPKSGGSYNKIIMVQSELWIEHYLRRNFSWYNSELWLDDLDRLHPDTKIVIGIAEKDEILSASKVLAEAKRYQAKNKNLNIIHWPNAGHAYAVPRPWTWKQLRAAIEGA